jgi:SAM-dependent methyltransferase
MNLRKRLLPIYIALIISEVNFYSCLFAEESRERIFTDLYVIDVWGTTEEVQESKAPEFTIENSPSYIDFLQNFIRANSIKTIVDAGCGDWSLSKRNDWAGASYVGFDIVKPVIEKNQKSFSSPQVTFIHGDVNEIDLPQADLLICKNLLQYLTNSDIHQFLKQIDKYKYCLITNDSTPSETRNRTIVCGDHRPLDLTLPPFNINGVKIFSYKVGNLEKEVLLITNNDRQSQKPSIKKKCFVINNIHPYQGFFSLFLTVINYLNLFDTQDICGLTVDFQNQGLYYEPAFGPNWWGYYFEPLNLGTSEGAIIDYSSPFETGRISYLGETGLSRDRVNELISKYIRVKPEIQNLVDQFAAEKFSGKYVIGVHYRGTDKFQYDSNSISYEDLSSSIQNFVNEKGLKDYVIYLATDEDACLNYMRQIFQEKLLFQDCLRSSDKTPIHYFNQKNTSPYKLGKEAMIDCLLLSKSNHLIRTCSYLSLVSTFFNPHLTETLLNKRKCGSYKRF